jgi:hypothetical protein
MRKPASNSMSAAIRFKHEADSVMAAEIELLMSVLPQLIAAMSAEVQVDSEPISVAELSLQQKNNLLLDNVVKSTEDVR